MVDYSKEWKAYQLRRNLAIIGFLGYLPVFMLFGLIFRHISWGMYAVGVFALAWFLGTFIVAISVQVFRCPRCGESFSATWWYNLSLFARKCVHCGLPKFRNG